MTGASSPITQYKFPQKNGEETEFDNRFGEKFQLVAYPNFKNVESIEISSNKNKKLQIIPTEKDRVIEIKKEELKKIYNYSIKNIISYILVIVGFAFVYLKRGLKFNFKNLGILSLSTLIYTIAVNPEWTTKSLGFYLALTLLYIIKNKEKVKGKIDLIVLGSLAVLILSLISECYANQKYNIMHEMFQFSLLNIVCMRIWDFSENDKEKLKKFLYISLLISGIIGIESPLLFSGVYVFNYGLLMALLFCISVINLLKSNQLIIKILIYCCGSVIGAYGIILSERRTLMVAVAAWLGCFVIGKFLIKKEIKKLVIILLGISLFYYVGEKTNKIDANFKKNVISILDTEKDESNIQRILMWRSSYFILKENPLLGIGVNNFYKEINKEKYKTIRHPKENYQEVFVHAHNEYLNTLLVKGLLGGIITLLIYSYIGYSLLKRKDKEFDIMLYSILIIYGIFEPFSIRSTGIIFFTFLGISLPLLGENNKKKEWKYYILILIYLIALILNKRFRYYFIIMFLFELLLLFLNKRRNLKLLIGKN